MCMRTLPIYSRAHMSGNHEGCKRALDSLELELLRDDSAVKSTYCSSRGPEFQPLNHSVAQRSLCLQLQGGSEAFDLDGHSHMSFVCPHTDPYT